MFPHDSYPFLKPDILPSAAAEMARKNVDGSRMFGGQEQAHTLASRLDAPGNIAVPPLAARYQGETEIG